MYLNEDHLRPTSNPHQGNIVRFLRSLVVSKSSGKNQKSRVFGKDLKQHLTEIKQESKLVIYLLTLQKKRFMLDKIYSSEMLQRFAIFLEYENLLVCSFLFHFMILSIFFLPNEMP